MYMSNNPLNIEKLFALRIKKYIYIKDNRILHEKK